tara:strand:+ start:799 stop:1536 length:738 start_codon:yes stop_codon:yes gene_type:complete
MKIIATIEARMNSTRLPGKVMMEIGGIPSLGYMVNRVKQSNYIDSIVIATTTNTADTTIVEYAKSMEGIYSTRGSENDVMGRVIQAGKEYNADIIVELTGDCPMIDPNIIDKAINLFLNYEVEYVSNVDIRSYPDGMDVQVMKLDTLIDSYKRTKSSLEREHVTLNIRRDKKRYRRIDMIAEDEVYWPDLGLTLDEDEDLKFLRLIVERLGKRAEKATCNDIVKLLKKEKELLLINQNIARKGDT